MGQDGQRGSSSLAFSHTETRREVAQASHPQPHSPLAAAEDTHPHSLLVYISPDDGAMDVETGTELYQTAALQLDGDSKGAGDSPLWGHNGC